MLCTPIEYAECTCEAHRARPYSSLTILLLDCWQREYDERPFKHFAISQNFFEKRMRRPFSHADWVVLVDFLEMRKLESFRISYIPMPNLEDDCLREHLVKGLLNVKSVQLRNVSLPIAFLVEFNKNIASSHVRSLDLSENDLTSDHLLQLRGILIQSCALTHFSVANCHMNENTFAILADGIYNSKGIQGVDISRPTPMSSVRVFESIKFTNIVAQLIWQNKLTEIHLRQCNLNGHDMEALSEYLSKRNSKLIILDLQSNNIASHGTEHLFKALTSSMTLTTLNLSANNLGSQGGMVIARYIQNTNIRSLDITHNQIGGEAVAELLSAIKKPRELKLLKMYGNQFCPKSAAILKRLLRAKVIEQSDIDLTYTWDHSNEGLCIIPSFVSGRIHN